MATIYITDLHLRAVIGTNDWERDVKQDILVNIRIDYSASKAMKSDKIKDTLDYKALTKEIIQMVEVSDCFLLEALAGKILEVVMKRPLVTYAVVRVDKPQALRFAKSVAVEVTSKDK
ncbi:MAG: dihydroneopterin aldolase [Omnitrophica WOR_2 bacterium GWA2_47_8]|nr:MAG: dihydroneopterin aldolase [Omnitrophica WOR_2 bacterium GWA2_47_8]